MKSGRFEALLVLVRRTRWWLRFALGVVLEALAVAMVCAAVWIHSWPPCPPGPGDCRFSPGNAGGLAVLGTVPAAIGAGVLIITWLRRGDRR